MAFRDGQERRKKVSTGYIATKRTTTANVGTKPWKYLLVPHDEVSERIVHSGSVMPCAASSQTGRLTISANSRTFANRAKLCNSLRATWERGLEDIAFVRVVHRHRDHMKAKDLKKVSALTEADCDAMRRCAAGSTAGSH